ncbi:signal peptidase I SipW [Bacillus sp. FSL K6-3431]|uniref:signal peptidase I SipW n=1 Tax=Bacillus sp. FSL K6-3431 TaxID=2921500 RepID=UPI0030F580EF
MNWRNVCNIISNITTTFVFILLIVTVCTMLFSRAAGGELSLFGYQLKMVLSGSMEPQIQTGSLISINLDGDRTSYKKGDVITYRTADDILITHRIKEVKGYGLQYITKGDNNNGPDIEPVLADNIIGKYTGFTVPYVGYFIYFANSRQGAVLLLILPGILLLGYSIMSIWRALQLVQVPKEST